MFAGPNTIAIKIGDYLQGTAEGPLGIAALLVVFLTAFAIAEIRRRRR
jgi:hypothetical protein